MFDDGQTLSPQDEIKRILGMRAQVNAALPTPPAPDLGGIANAAAKSANAVQPPQIAAPNTALPPVVPQRQTDTDELNRLKNSPAGVEQLQHKHPILGTIARIGDVALSSLFPTVAVQIPGTELHHAGLVNRAQSRVTNDLAGEETQAKTAHDTAETGLETAQTAAIPAHTALQEAQAHALGEPKPKEEEWDVVQGFSGPNGEPILKEKNSGQMKLATSIPGLKSNKLEKPDTPERQFIDDAIKHGKSIAQAVHEYAAQTQKPEHEPKQLAIGPDGTVLELRPGMKVPQGTQTPSAELGKPNADEQRRADLANNMNENLDQLKDIVTRRPDLFGPVSGRLTSLKQFVGSSDPDVAKLHAIHEYLGMASVGAHAMRNAQHVGVAADAVMAGFKNSPEAIIAAIDQAKKSTATFAQDLASHRGVGAPPTPAGPVSFREGGDIYDIPPDKAAAFKRSHPNAVQQ